MLTPVEFKEMCELASWIEGELLLHPMFQRWHKMVEDSLGGRIDGVINSPEEQTYTRGTIAGVRECLDSFAATVRAYGSGGAELSQHNPGTDEELP